MYISTHKSIHNKSYYIDGKVRLGQVRGEEGREGERSGGERSGGKRRRRRRRREQERGGLGLLGPLQGLRGSGPLWGLRLSEPLQGLGVSGPWVVKPQGNWASLGPWGIGASCQGSRGPVARGSLNNFNY